MNGQSLLQLLAGAPACAGRWSGGAAYRKRRGVGSDDGRSSFRQMWQHPEQSGHFGKTVLDAIRWDIQHNYGQVESAKVLLVGQILVRGHKHIELGLGLGQ